MVTMWSFWILSVSLAAAAAADDDKIINGYECQPHSQPWQVFLTTQGYRWCGGSIINEYWILSAAHCEQPADTLIAHVGEHDTTVEEGTEQRLPVAQVIPHPFYNPRSLDNDIMLLRLAAPIIFGSNAQPVPLSSSCPKAGLQCLVSGWGNLLTDGVEYPAKLQCLEIPVLSVKTCLAAYPGKISLNMFCAGFMEGGKDACQGDSGGPVVCNGKLEGIVSWGIGCAMKSYPGVYTKVCNYIDWIKATTAAN